MAIGTITATLERIQTPQGRPKLVVITLLCTAGAAGDANAHLYPSTVINDLVDFDLRGLKLYSIATIPGTTGPTDNSDLTITDRYGVDILAGAGANLVDNATKNRTVIGIASAVIITGDITLDIINNAVDSAATTVVLELIGA